MFKWLLYWWQGLFTCRVYGACKMTGRKRSDMIKRAKYLEAKFKEANIELISPVLRERVRNKPGVLKNPSKLRLFKKWRDDKDIICWESHGLVWDFAQDKSFGAEEEHGRNRYTWWKPTARLLPEPHGLVVSVWEDDLITGDVEAVAHYFSEHHGNIYKRWKWRLAMLNHSLVKFVIGQVWQFLH